MQLMQWYYNTAADQLLAMFTVQADQQCFHAADTKPSIRCIGNLQTHTASFT